MNDKLTAEKSFVCKRKGRGKRKKEKGKGALKNMMNCYSNQIVEAFLVFTLIL